MSVLFIFYDFISFLQRFDKKALYLQSPPYGHMGIFAADFFGGNRSHQLSFFSQQQFYDNETNFTAHGHCLFRYDGNGSKG